MARNGSGLYSRVQASYVFNTIIDQVAVNSELDDISTALTNSLTKNGETTATANQPMGTFRHTGVGNGVARTDYPSMGQLEDGTVNWVAGGGTADAITATYAPVLTALVDGQLCFVRATAANATATPTFAPNGLTARTITLNGGQALVAGNIFGAGHELILRYKLATTVWELLNPSLTSSSGSSLVGYLPAGTGAVVTTVQAKEREIASVFDFMSDAQKTDAITYTGAVDSAAAFNAVMLAHKHVFIPRGAYLWASTVSAQQDGNLFSGAGDATVVRYTGAAVAFSLNAKQNVTVEHFRLFSKTATIGIYIGDIAHWFKIRDVNINGSSTESLISGAINGFSTAAIQIERSYYGEVVGCDISYVTTGIHGFRECNGNAIYANSIRQFVRGIQITDTTSNSDGCQIYSNQIESAQAGTLYGIQILGGDSNQISSNRIELTAGTAHINIDSGVSFSQYANLIGNMCEGSIAGIILGNGAGSSNVRDAIIIGGRGTSLTVNVDCDNTIAKIGYAAYGTSITNNSVTSYIDYMGSLSFSCGITGLTTSPTATFKYTISGDTVIVYTQTLNGTSNTTDCTLTGFPAAIRPRVNTQVVIVPLQNNGAFVIGTLEITTGGVVTLSTSALGGTAASFAAANGKGLLGSTFSYKLN